MLIPTGLNVLTGGKKCKDKKLEQNICIYGINCCMPALLFLWIFSIWLVQHFVFYNKTGQCYFYMLYKRSRQNNMLLLELCCLTTDVKLNCEICNFWRKKQHDTSRVNYFLEFLKKKNHYQFSISMWIF